MGLQLLANLKDSVTTEPVHLPVFDKAVDDRAPRSTWRTVTPPFNIILFEGWCVGTTPQQLEELRQPVNSLEEQDDPRGTWRNHVNAQLAGDYARLFAEIDLLIMLEVPDMECVFAWRGLQEKKLARQKRHTHAMGLMDESTLRRFIMHYERLTRHMLAEMPERANLVLRLDRFHQVESVRINHWPVFANTP
jgi:D-glycerate 3-kinase